MVPKQPRCPEIDSIDAHVLVLVTGAGGAAWHIIVCRIPFVTLFPGRRYTVLSDCVGHSERGRRPIPVTAFIGIR